MDTTTDWRRKYVDALREAEAEARQWRRLEALLRRIASRLAAAAVVGRAEVDEPLGQLASACRGEAGEAELATLFAAATEALGALPRIEAEPAPAAVAVAPAVPSLGDIQRATARLLDRLADMPEFAARAMELAAQLRDATDEAGIAVAIGAVAELLGDQQGRVERERAEAAAVLHQVGARLDEITQLIAGGRADLEAGTAAIAEFDTRMHSEVSTLSGRLAGITDLEVLQLEVHERLAAMSSHLSGFREREAERASAQRERVERMAARVRDLEHETTELQRNLLDEHRRAVTDALTGIANRLAWDRRLAEELARFARFSVPTAVAIWDIDHFKAVNDAWGHRAGDKVIRTVAALLASATRGTDFVARYGGEEYAMLLPGAGSEQAVAVCEKLRQRVAATRFHFRGTPVAITISCGVTQLRPGDGVEDVFERADNALYLAKQDGRNRCRAG